MAIKYLDAKRIRGSSTGDFVAGQGYDGAAGVTNIAGGGGGAGATGSSKNGGNGKASSITGSSVTYAGGGAGSADGSGAGGSGGSGGGGNGGSNNQASVGGTDGLGGGCGGGGNVGGNDSTGGSGVVILRFTTSGTTYSTSGSPNVDTSTVSGKTILKYLASGTFVVSGGTPNVEYLVVAGGGGSMTNWGHSGGSGAGGMIEGTKSSMSNATYTVTVGAGGVGSTSAPLQGGNSVFSDVTATGGGYGGNWVSGSTNAGGSGGSGGGAQSGSSNYAGGTGIGSSSTDEKATLITTFPDTLGSAADATNSGAVVDNATAIYGQKSLIFTSDTVNLGNDLDAITSEFTFTCWAYFESQTASSTHKTIISKPATTSWASPLYHSFTVQHAASSTNVELVVNDGSTYRSITVALSEAGWHFITVTKTSGHVWVLKVDDASSATMTYSPTWGTQDWVIGNTPYNTRYWDGKIQDVAFWSRVLTGAEQTTLFTNNATPAVDYNNDASTTSTNTGKVATEISLTGLKAYYTFNDATTGVTNGATDYSDLPENTIFEETDTRKILFLQSNEWVRSFVAPTYATDFSTTVSADNLSSDNSSWTDNSSRMRVDTSNEWLYFEIRRDSTDSRIYYDFGVGNISNTDWTLRMKVNITALSGGSASEKSWLFGLSSGGSSSFSDDGNLLAFGHRMSSSSSERDIVLRWADDDDGNSNIAEIGSNLLVNGTTYYYELQRIGTTTLRGTLYSDSDYSVVVATLDRTITAGDGEDLRYFRGANVTYSSTLAGNVNGNIEDLKFYNGVVL